MLIENSNIEKTIIFFLVQLSYQSSRLLNGGCSLILILIKFNLKKYNFKVIFSLNNYLKLKLCYQLISLNWTLEFYLKHTISLIALTVIK